MKVGLEIHQQLQTGKLFCHCSGELSEEGEGHFVRILHATRGEGGERDRAAALQSAKGEHYRYEVTTNSCLVEADEEPPRPLNPAALRVALTLTEMLGAQAPDEMLVMRKIVVDGSNTTGFQRTVVVALDGELKIGERSYGIGSICLEEDAARKMSEKDGEVLYRLDRLGIPLIEIATEPDIRSGREAREVAEALGMLLRSTRKVRRGIGTIREDLNVSTDGGARVEIKGVQELALIEDYVENEVRRQRILLERREQLRARHPDPPPSTVDLAPTLRGASSRVLASGLHPGGGVLGLRLPGYAGLLRSPEGVEERLGREFADYARASGVSGLLHSDELPAYGVTAEEVQKVYQALEADPSRDGFVIVVSNKRSKAEAAISAVRARALQALEGVPEETRDPLPDGRTRYSRPLPGRNRMYPETDLPPCRVGTELLSDIRTQMPERPEATRDRLEALGLSRELAVQLLRGEDLESFDLLVLRKLPINLVARALTQELPALEREAARPLFKSAEAIPDLLEPVLRAVEEKRFSKEGLAPVLKKMLVDGLSLEEAITASGLSGMGTDELDKIVLAVLDSNEPLIRERGMGAIGPLMGDVMARVRGKRDGREVSEALNRRLRERVAPEKGS